MLRSIEPVVQETEEARRVAFHQELGAGILRPQRSLAADVLLEPRIVDETEVRAGEPRVEIVAADPAPGREVVRAARVHARARDVEESGERLPNPRSAVVLIGDRVDAEPADERRERSPASAWRAPSTAPARARSARPTPAPTAGAGRRGQPRR